MTAFHVPDMTCGGCAGRIQRAIVATDDKARIEINLRERLVVISGTATDAEYAEAVQEAGYTPELVEPGPEPANAKADTGNGACCGTKSRAASCCG